MTSLDSSRLALMIGTDDRDLGEGLSVYYVWARAENGSTQRVLDAERRTVLAASRDGSNSWPSLPSISHEVPAASWYEREIADMLGIQFEDSPDNRPLVFHDGRPDENFPLRKDFDPAKPLSIARQAYSFASGTGEGVFQIPVGPVHAGIIEPGHFRFTSVGEKVLGLELRLFYKHRGLEKLAEGMSFEQGAMLAERIAGDETIANSVAYCRAVEELAGVDLPARATGLRVLFQELERVHSHLNDLVGIATDVAFGVGAMTAARIREEVLRFCNRLTGSRFMRGMIVPGGVTRDLTGAELDELAAVAPTIGVQVSKLRSLLIGTTSVVDRLEGTGVLDARDALALATVGPVARASGLPYDARRDLVDHLVKMPQQIRRHLEELTVPTRKSGDCLRRTEVRFDELDASLRLIERIAGDLPGGPVQVALPTNLPPLKWAIGAAEAPRGETLHFIMTSEDRTTIRRYKPRTPSRCNWLALPLAFDGDIIPDFPLVNKSFNLSYAGSDL